MVARYFPLHTTADRSSRYRSTAHNNNNIMRSSSVRVRVVSSSSTSVLLLFLLCCNAVCVESFLHLPQVLFHQRPFSNFSPLAAGVPAEELSASRLVVFTTSTGLSTLGLVRDKDGKRNWVIESASGRSSVSPKNIRFTLPGEGFTANDRDSIDKGSCRNLESDIEELVPLAWELLADEKEGVSATKFAELVLGSDGPLDSMRAFKMLDSDLGRAYFKWRPDGLCDPRSEDVSSMIVGQIRATQDEAKSLQLLVEVIGRSLKGEGSEHLVVDELSIAHQRIISGLKAMARASQGRDPPSEEEELAYPLLDALGRSSTRSSAFQICTELGLLGKHDNFMLAGSVFSSPFSAEALASSEQILSSPPLDPDESTRKDLTHLRTYTIDSESTREVDDALSIEQLPDGRERLWVHIADVSRWVREGDHLHVEASRRQTTLYLPDAIYPMFPMILAKDIFSLNTGEPRCALSMGVILAEDGSIEDVEVTPSLVQVDMRLSYEDADEMLREGITGPGGEEESLGRLYHWSGIRKALRCSNGSVDRFMRPPQFTIKVEEDPEAEDGLSISISPDDPELPSVNLVSEMMIMSGEGMALVARQHGIGMPFRVQPPPESIPDSEYFDDFPERFCRAKAYYRFMSAASVTSSHAPHWGLGLNSYVQWSSPIRRFNDLAVHYQVKKWLRGDPLLDGPQIAVGVSALDGTLSMATKIARKSDRYWLHEYLRRAGIAAVEFEAYVISSRDSANGSKVLYEFLLTELGSIVIHAENSDCLALGETVIVTVRGASPRDGMLRLVWRRAD